MHRKSVGFKALTITCLALALISTISLNIIRTYSINNTRTNALGDSSLGSSSATTSQGSAATLTNDPNYISISLSNATGSSEPTSGNILITTPTGGGIATGSHTITIHTSSLVSGYNVTLHSSGGDTDLVPSDFGKGNNNLIEPAGGSANPAPLTNPTTLANNQWGVALPGSTLYPNKYSNTNDYTSTDQTTLANTKYAAIPGKGSSDDQDSTILTKNSPANQATGDSTTIYYGVKVSPSIQADAYSAEVTYTATATIPAPTLTKLILNDSVQVGQTSEFAIEGTNLDTVSSIKLCPTGQQPDTTNTNCYEVPSKDIDTYLDDTTTSTKGTILSFTNSAISEPGTYDLYTISPAGQTKLDQPFIVQEESTCRNGDPSSDCQVDIDDNMIPIYYAGNNTDGSAIWKVANINNPGEWYDYANKQWANAVTVQSDKLTTYQNKPGTVINNNDVLGYWVYIPRYAYEVQRPNAIDRVVADEYPLPDNTNSTGNSSSPYNTHSIRNEFSIHFEKATDTKKTPAETCNILNPTKDQMWANGTPTAEAGPDNTNILAKDYRTNCASPGNTNGQNNATISRLYTDATAQTGTNTTANNTTWATHPAFTFGGTELNGLWIGKFETTGTVTNPTVKPNQHANILEHVGEFYTMAKHIGVYDPSNTGGNDITANGTTLNATGQWTSLHNLSTATSHMLKNSEWGAITYLASSKYGAGTNNVSINSAYPSKSADADLNNSSSNYRTGITGCGPNNSSRSTSVYTDGTPLSASTIESATACSTDPELGSRRAYNGDIGQLASTTNNIYGIYDMSGGAYEYVMGNLTGCDDQSESSSVNDTKNAIALPYVDLYKESPYDNFTSDAANNPVKWSSASAEYAWNNDVCAWGTCGGHALHETKRYQSVSGEYQSWERDNSSFANSDNRWFLRGGSAYSGAGGGLFYFDSNTGKNAYDYGFRVAIFP